MRTLTPIETIRGRIREILGTGGGWVARKHLIARAAPLSRDRVIRGLRLMAETGEIEARRAYGMGRGGGRRVYIRMRQTSRDAQHAARKQEPSVPLSRLKRFVQFHNVETWGLKYDLQSLIEEFENKETTIDKNQNFAVSGEPANVAPEIDPVDPSVPLPSAQYIAVSCCPDASFGTEEIRGRIRKAIDLERDHASARVHAARKAVDVAELAADIWTYMAPSQSRSTEEGLRYMIERHLGAGSGEGA